MRKIKTENNGLKPIYLFYLFLFCSFFSINKFLVNPVYILGFFVILTSFFAIKIKKFDKFQLFLYFYFFISLLGFLIGIVFFNRIDSDVVYLSSFLYLYCIILGAQTLQVGINLTVESRVRVYESIYNFLIFYMSLDLIIRLVVSKNTGSFYDYKWGIFYFDSNFSALIILIFLMFSIFLKVKGIYNIGYIRFYIICFLLLSTFSRASIFAFVLSYFLYRFGRKYIFIISLIFSILAIYLFYDLVLNYLSGNSFVNIDGSFNSKFYLISVALDNYYNLPVVNKIFGIGLVNFSYYSNGIFAHNILITFFYEFGFFGILCFVLLLFYSYKKIGKDIFYVIIPFFISGFSLFSAYMPFFFIILACMYIETRGSRDN